MQYAKRAPNFGARFFSQRIRIGNAVALSQLDRLIAEVDNGLRTVFAVPHANRKPMPAGECTAAAPASLTAEEKQQAIRLMRVNHCGEVCAQALYQGQAFVAQEEQTRELLLRAAGEERDHLAWCARRVSELGGRTSVLSPVFYAGSFAIGAVSGMLGDKWSMGFLVETERQVEAHLDAHLDRLADADTESRRIVEAMRQDEINHGNAAEAHGAARLPPPVRAAMRVFSKVMTETTYRI
jgi:3-demethoxyubiquinol 3-hydroxylase